MVKKKFLAFAILISLLFIVLISFFQTEFVIAEHVVNNSSGGISFTFNEDITNLFNISINNTESGEGGATANISQVNVTLWSYFNFTTGTDGTSTTPNVSFSNTSTILSWSNFTLYLINGTEKKYFWFNATSNTPGVYNITITTFNGTVVTANLSVTVNDTTPPHFINYTVPTPVNGTNLSQNYLRVNVTSLDNFNVSTFKVYLHNKTGQVNNTNVTNSSFAFLNFTDLPDGTYYISTIVNDSNGNQNSSDNRTVMLDTAGPVITFRSSTPVNGSFLSSTIPVNITASDNLSSVSTIRVFLYNASGTLINNTNFSASSATFSFGSLTTGVYHLNITANDTLNNENLTSGTRIYTYASAYYSFNGTIKDEDGHLINNSVINVTLKSMAGFSTVGYVSTTSNASGWFNLSLPESVCSGTCMFQPIITRTNTTNSTFQYVDFISKSLPALPGAQIPTLSGATFYLTPAATINITVLNQTGERINFTYQVKDTKLGYPIAEEHAVAVNETVIFVPRNRNYSIMVYPYRTMPVSFNWYNFSVNYSYDFGTNNISKYNETIHTVHKRFNLTTVMVRVSGVANYSGITLNGGWTNLTVIPYLLEAGNMVHAEYGDMPYDLSVFNGTNDAYNITNGTFNISLPAPVETSSIILFAVARNGTNYYGQFRNISLNYDSPPASNEQTQFNFSKMTKLVGDSANISMDMLAGGVLNVSTAKQRFYLQNSSNKTLGNVSAHVEVKVDYSSYQCMEFTWMTDIAQSQATSYFDIPLINSTGVKEINVFASGGGSGGGQYAPRRVSTINANQIATDNNITIKNFNPQDIGGALSSGEISIELFTSNSTCDVPYPPVGCSLGGTKNMNTSDTANGFNPMQAVMGGGKISFRMGTRGILVHYVNADMLASGPPDALFDSANTNTTSTSTFDSVVRFGSQGPTIYDHVIISMPYTEGSVMTTGLNEEGDINMSIPNLYDDNWNVIWDTSSNGTDVNALAGNYSHYSAHSTEWQTLINFTNCTKTAANFNSANPCYVNTTNNHIWIRLPHFSGTGPKVSGGIITADAISPGSASPSSSGTTFWINTQSVTAKQFTDGYSVSLPEKYRVQVTVDKKLHYIGVVDLTATTATINVSSKPQQAVFNIGDEKKFDVTNDSYYDVSVKLNSIANNKASITIKQINEKITEPAAIPETSPTTPESETNLTAPPTKPGVIQAISNNILLIVLIIVIIVIIALYVIFSKKSHKRTHEKIKVYNF